MSGGHGKRVGQHPSPGQQCVLKQRPSCEGEGFDLIFTLRMVKSHRTEAMGWGKERRVDGDLRMGFDRPKS